MFSAKIWFVKTSTRIVKYQSQIIKSNPETMQDNFFLLWHFLVSNVFISMLCMTVRIKMTKKEESSK